MSFPSYYTFEHVERPVPICVFCDRPHSEELSMFSVTTKENMLYKYICESCLTFLTITYQRYNEDWRKKKENE